MKRSNAISLVLRPEGLDDLDAWSAACPGQPDCVEFAEEVARMSRAAERYRLPDRPDVDAPVLVLTGTAGPEFLRESALAVRSALASSRLVEFDGVGHSAPGEASERTAGAVESFLRARL